MRRNNLPSITGSTIGLAVAMALLTLANASVFSQNTNAIDPGRAAGRPVKLNLIVVDGDNHFRDDIRKEDIRVFEGKAEQTITFFEKDERPIDYGIAIDMSGSLKSVLGSLLDAMKLLIDHNRTADQIFIERFVSSDKIETVQNFTSDKDLLLAGRKQLRVEGGQTAVVDGVYLAVDYVARNGRKDARKAVVLITDGEDRASYYSIDKLVTLLHKTEVPVFIIGVTVNLDKEPGLIRKNPRQKAELLLRTIAEESRGRVFLPENVRDLEQATNEILHDLQRQYVIGYNSTTEAGSSDFQKVEVKAADEPKGQKLKIIAPRGYWLKPPSLSADKQTSP